MDSLPAAFIPGRAYHQQATSIRGYKLPILKDDTAAMHHPSWLVEHGTQIGLFSIAAQVSKCPRSQMAAVGQTECFGRSPGGHGNDLTQIELPLDASQAGLMGSSQMTVLKHFLARRLTHQPLDHLRVCGEGGSIGMISCQEQASGVGETQQ